MVHKQQLHIGLPSLEPPGVYTRPGLWLRGGGQGFPPATMNVASSYFHMKVEEKIIQPKEIPSCLTPCLLVVFTRQLEILVTSLLHCDITTHSHLGITYAQMYGQKRGLRRIWELSNTLCDIMNLPLSQPSFLVWLPSWQC